MFVFVGKNGGSPIITVGLSQDGRISAEGARIALADGNSGRGQIIFISGVHFVRTEWR